MICLDTNSLILGLVPESAASLALVEWTQAGESLVTAISAWYDSKLDSCLTYFRGLRTAVYHHSAAAIAGGMHRCVAGANSRCSGVGLVETRIAKATNPIEFPESKPPANPLAFPTQIVIIPE